MCFFFSASIGKQENAFNILFSRDHTIANNMQLTYLVQVYKFAGVVSRHAVVGCDDDIDTILHLPLLQTVKQTLHCLVNSR